MLNKMHEFFLNRWFIATLIMTIPAYWFYVIRYWGSEWGIVNSNDTLTVVGCCITGFLFLVSFTLTFAKNYHDYRDMICCKVDQRILTKILSCVKILDTNKIRTLTNHIRANEDNPTWSNLYRSRQLPMTNIQAVVEQLKFCLDNTLGIDLTCIGISIIHKSSDQESWEWSCADNTGGLTIDELVSNRKSSVYQIIHQSSPTLFYADKRTAVKDSKYVYDPNDKNHEYIGSIVCRDISIVTEGNKYIQAILKISTYGSHICPEGDKGARRILEYSILPPFEAKIKLEILTHHINTLLP